MNLCLLHGFWGQPSDWQRVLPLLKQQDYDFFIPDLYSKSPLDPRHSLEQWTENFLRVLEKKWGNEPCDLVGYSMGGRLAMHAALKRPERFRRVLLLSTRPGLMESEKESRQQWVEEWREKFRRDTWSHLIEGWDAQEIFNYSEPIGRRCEDTLRPYLVRSLENWSLLHHSVDWFSMKQAPKNIDWYFGELDEKFLPVVKGLKEYGVQGEVATGPGGHRILWEAPEVVAQWIRKEL